MMIVPNLSGKQNKKLEAKTYFCNLSLTAALSSGVFFGLTLGARTLRSNSSFFAFFALGFRPLVSRFLSSEPKVTLGGFSWEAHC